MQRSAETGQFSEYWAKWVLEDRRQILLLMISEFEQIN